MTDALRRTTRVVVTLSGLVQGVGFRFTVLRIAARHPVAGTVRNLHSGDRLEIDTEGDAVEVEAFLREVLENPPRGARVDRVERRTAQPRGATGFTEASSAEA
ncbi:MAG TPA: acylphosphatase [Candidatus Elarobacter sp.]